MTTLTPFKQEMTTVGSATAPGFYSPDGALLFFHMDSPLGVWGFAQIDGELSEMTFIGASEANLHRCRPAETKLERQLESLLTRYFQGEDVDFSTIPMRFPVETKLTARVMRALQALPFGTLLTYGELAVRMNLPKGYARAIGGALGRNPLPILVPCHRVIASQKKIGGFMRNCPPGPGIKAYLLTLEGHHVDGLHVTFRV